jgi:hypothetical protein
MIHLRPLAGISLAMLVHVSWAQTSPPSQPVPACPTYPVSLPVMDATTLTQAPHIALAEAIAAVPAGMGVSLPLRGTFVLTQPLRLNRACVTIKSASTSSRATLRWAGAIVDAYSSFMIDNENLALPWQQASHRITLDGLVFEGLGVRLNGLGHRVINNTFQTMPNGLTLQFAQSATATGNTFKDAGGFGSWILVDSSVSSNTFTRTVQPISVAGSARGNLFNGNQATGTRQFGLELLGAEASLPANNRNVGNVISGNRFSEPVVPTQSNNNQGSSGGISVPNGTSNSITGNVLSCPGICPDYGIEAAGVYTVVRNNEVTGFRTGIFLAESAPGNPSDDRTDAILNRVNRSEIGIDIGCTAGAASGADSRDARISGCRKAYRILNNTIRQAVYAGIGGTDFYKPYTLDASGNKVLLSYPDGSGTQRYTISTASESTGLLIQGNVIERTYGEYPGDESVPANSPRFAGITLGPILNPAGLVVERNTITFTGQPVQATRFQFVGVRATMPVWYDQGVCQKLPGSTSYSGSVVRGNTVKNATVASGTAVQGVCNAVNGLSVSSNTFSWLQDAVADEHNIAGLKASGNVCNNVTRGVAGCQ